MFRASIPKPIWSWSAGTLQIPPGSTFTRAGASGANYFDANGLLVNAGANIPRFDYSGLGVPGKLNGLLIENAATNLALRSRNGTNATWVKTTMSTAQNQPGLDGTANSATTITASGANATILQTITAANVQYTTSFYIKRLTGSGTVQITMDNGSTWTTCAGLSSSVFTRYTLTQTQLNPVIGIRLVTNADAVIFDCVQMETGEYASSPIITTSATVSRTADLCTMPVTGMFNPTQGTLYARFVPYYEATSATARQIANLSDGSTNNRASMVLTAASALVAGRVTSATATQLSTTTVSTAVTLGAESASVVAWCQDAFPYVVGNNGTLKLGTATLAPVGMTTLTFGSLETAAVTQNLTGALLEVAIYPQMLAPNMAAALTQGR